MVPRGPRGPEARGFAIEPADANTDVLAWLWFGRPEPADLSPKNGAIRYSIGAALSGYRPHPLVVKLARKDLPTPFAVRASKPAYYGYEQGNEYQEYLYCRALDDGNALRPHPGQQDGRRDLAPDDTVQAGRPGRERCRSGRVRHGQPVPPALPRRGSLPVRRLPPGEGRRTERLLRARGRRREGPARAAYSCSPSPPRCRSPSGRPPDGWSGPSATPTSRRARSAPKPAPTTSPTGRGARCQGRGASQVPSVPAYGRRPLRVGHRHRHPSAIPHRRRVRRALATKAQIDRSKFTTAERSVSYSSLSGDVLVLQHPGGPGGKPHAWTNGTELVFSDWPVYDSPYLNEPLKAGRLTVSDGAAEALVIDQSGDRPEWHKPRPDKKELRSK